MKKIGDLISIPCCTECDYFWTPGRRVPSVCPKCFCKLEYAPGGYVIRINRKWLFMKEQKLDFIKEI